jgi:carbamate kinase
VGRLVLQNEYAVPVTPAMPFDVCNAMSQGMIGYHIQQSVGKIMHRRGLDTRVVSLVTQVVVDENDPMFKNPTKPIGPFYTEEEAKAIAAEKGYAMKEDAGRGWRRVVASPMPVEITEIAAVKCLIDNGFIVITVGGGGIPVIKDAKGELTGTAAVIDKDLASEKLAENIDANALVILTAVEKVSLNYRKSDQKDLDTITAAEAKQYISDGHFAPGSMLPKIQAAVMFVESKPGRKAIITSLDKALDALTGKAGTTIVN